MFPPVDLNDSRATQLTIDFQRARCTDIIQFRKSEASIRKKKLLKRFEGPFLHLTMASLSKQDHHRHADISYYSRQLINEAGVSHRN